MYFKNKDCCEIYIHHQETKQGPYIERDIFEIFEIVNPYLEMDDAIFKIRGELFF